MFRAKKTVFLGAQIDIIIDRADKMINVCEVKYCEGTYTLDKSEYEKLINRMNTFSRETGTRSGLYLTMITTEGLTAGKYANKIGMKALVIAGPDEIAAGNVTVKNLLDRTQKTLSFREAAALLKEITA